MEEGMVLISS